MADFGLQQSQSQQQTFTPQMGQGLELLQANTLELSQLIRQAIEINPVIEEISSSISLDEIRDGERDQRDQAQDRSDDDDRDYWITESAQGADSTDAQKKRDFLFDSLVHPETLQSNLLDQLSTSAIIPEVTKAAETLIGSLDDRGFLTATLQELADKEQLSLDHLEEALILIQGFHPPGVGATDFQESLLIQLELIGYNVESLPHQIVSHHLNALAKSDHQTLAKSLKAKPTEIEAATQLIASLNPNPGAQFDATHNPEIIPDLEISPNKQGQWKAHLLEDNQPQLRISEAYKDILAQSSANGKDESLRHYLRQQIQEGRNLIKSLELRKLTLLQLADVLIEKQRAFLESGSSELKPLTMQEVAEQLELNPSTISRAVRGKYLLTPHGLSSLRAFFEGGVTTDSGENLATTSIKETILQLVKSESPEKPLSDSAIHKTLSEKGIKIARRTIAKYREQLKILPSHLRKKAH